MLLFPGKQFFVQISCHIFPWVRRHQFPRGQWQNLPQVLLLYILYIVCPLTSGQEYTNLLFFSLAGLYLSLLPFSFLQLPTRPDNPFYPLSMPLIICKHMSMCTVLHYELNQVSGQRESTILWKMIYLHTLLTTM